MKACKDTKQRKNKIEKIKIYYPQDRVCMCVHE